MITARTMTAAVVCALSTAAFAGSESVDFRVDPATIDTDMDGFITGSEFAPVGSDGTVFQLTPTNNLVGGDRFLLSDDKGIHYGGGGGSTLSFDFTASQSIELETYTLSSSGFFLGDPTFDILEGASTLSAGNTSNPQGATIAFNGGPLTILAGTTYSFDVTHIGAGIQAFMESWNYTVIPAPAGVAALAFAGLAATRRRR